MNEAILIFVTAALIEAKGKLDYNKREFQLQIEAKGDEANPLNWLVYDEIGNNLANAGISLRHHQPDAAEWFLKRVFETAEQFEVKDMATLPMLKMALEDSDENPDR